MLNFTSFLCSDVEVIIAASSKKVAVCLYRFPLEFTPSGFAGMRAGMTLSLNVPIVN
jgi:hypothetical protein